MNSDDKALMKKFGITSESKTIFHFDGHKYERLSDAVNYANTRLRPPPLQKMQDED